MRHAGDKVMKDQCLQAGASGRPESMRQLRRDEPPPPRSQMRPPRKAASDLKARFLCRHFGETKYYSMFRDVPSLIEFT